MLKAYDYYCVIVSLEAEADRQHYMKTAFWYWIPTSVSTWIGKATWVKILCRSQSRGIIRTTPLSIGLPEKQSCHCPTAAIRLIIISARYQLCVCPQYAYVIGTSASIPYSKTAVLLNSKWHSTVRYRCSRQTLQRKKTNSKSKDPTCFRSFTPLWMPLMPLRRQALFPGWNPDKNLSPDWCDVSPTTKTHVWRGQVTWFLEAQHSSPN